jgi:hypothetical protein
LSALQAAATLQRCPAEQVAIDQFREAQLAVQSAATYVQAATTGTLADQVRLLARGPSVRGLGSHSLARSSSS